MIINVRGTFGSGKTTLVRTLMREYDDCLSTAICIDRRRKPVGYVLERSSGERLFVPGHYEGNNGGIDNLDIDDAYCLIKHFVSIDLDVLYEGRSFSDSSNRMMKNFSPSEVTIIMIDHPIDLCMESICERGNVMKEKIVRNIYRKEMLSLERLRSAGYIVHTLCREDALTRCKELLGI